MEHVDDRAYNWAAENAPWLLVIIVVISVVGWGLRILNDISPTIRKILGPLGRHWAERSARRFIRTGADYENMSKQILYLFARVHYLEYNSQLDHQYLVADAEWHKEADFALAGNPVILPSRVSYLEFRKEYQERFPYRKPDTPGELI